MITKFDNRYSPLFRWDCENLLDYSGNGLHLTGTSPVFRQVYGNTIGLSPPVILSRNSVHDVALQDYDDLTIQILCLMRTTLSSGTYILAFQSGGESEATDYSWSVVVTQNSVAYFAEYGPGSDVVYTVALPQLALPALGVPFNLTMRRKAVTGGVIVQFSINGQPYGPPSGVLHAPSGGTTNQLVFNQNGTGVDLIAVEIDNAYLTDLQIVEAYNRTLGEDFGYLEPKARSLWVGALTDEGATVAVQVTCASDDISLAVTGPVGTAVSPAFSVDSGGTLKFVLDGLDPDTEYEVEIYHEGVLVEGPTGRFRTAPSSPCSFMVAFGGDSITGSNALVFETILNMYPEMFIQMGDIHYHNISTNDQAAYHAAWDEILANPAQERQARLYREIPTAYGWDDHDSGANNHDGSSASIPAAAAVYRQRVPHYPLPDTLAVYQTWDIGRVRFVLTDQRTYSSPNANTDNSSKSMLGSAQKTWFKNILSNSSGYLIVWICPRWFGTPTTAGADSWGGFSTERAELATHIHANCPGRVVVLSADVHGLGIDDGSHHDFLPGGGEPLRCFQASPLDIAAPGITGTYSAGSFAINGVFGTMEVTDTGGSSVDVTWRGFNTAGTQLASLSFTVSL